MRPLAKTVCLGIALASGSGVARASFELLPGPIAGGFADGMTKGVWDSPVAGTKVSLAVARPAAVTDLVGAHAALSGSMGGRFVTAEIYRFSLADLYSEAVLGVWGGGRAIRAGLRRWHVGWSGLEQWAGWSLGAFARLRFRGVRVTPGVQDVALGKSLPSAPPRRLGARVELRVSTDLDLGLDLWESRDRGLDGRVRWSPVRDLVLEQSFRLPQAEFSSGVEIQVARVRWSFWFSPSSLLGERVGASCTLRLRDGPRQ